MEENDTIQQLSKALNQLLDAYEELQTESKDLKEENAYLKEEIDDLELRNKGLDSRLAALNDTTKQNSSEMGTMLGRIENILSKSHLEDEEEEIDESSFEVDKDLLDTSSVQKEADKNEEVTDAKDLTPNETKERDLARVESMLNGFKN